MTYLGLMRHRPTIPISTQPPSHLYETTRIGKTITKMTRAQTSASSMPALPTVKSRFGYHSIAYLAADRWNSLPSYCRLCESSAHFIHTIKSLLGYRVIRYSVGTSLVK